MAREIHIVFKQIRGDEEIAKEQVNEAFDILFLEVMNKAKEGKYRLFAEQK